MNVIGRIRSSDQLTPATVASYLRASAPIRLAVGRATDAFLDVDPVQQSLTLYVPANGGTPQTTEFERLQVARGVLAGQQGNWFSVQVDASDAAAESYALLEAMLEAVEQGTHLEHAIPTVVETFRHLLGRRGRLSEEREVGLIGELLVLRHAVGLLEGAHALACWLGPDSGEHDFSFLDADVEVKTTRGERRAHRIGSETQLSPNPDRPLYLVSLQLTVTSGHGATATLPELVDELRVLTGESQSELNRKLQLTGWDERGRDLYRTSYGMRSQPLAFLVDDQFPALTRGHLQTAVPNAALVTDVNYRVDVTSIQSSVAPSPLTDFCQGDQ